jgi:hypothetical protein
MYSQQLVFVILVMLTGEWGGVVIKLLRHGSDGPGIDPRWCNLGFFSVVPSNKTMCPEVDSASSTRDFSWGKDGRCVWLTTYHPFSAESREDPGP